MKWKHGSFLTSLPGLQHFVVAPWFPWVRTAPFGGRAPAVCPVYASFAAQRQARGLRGLRASRLLCAPRSLDSEEHTVF